MIYILTIVISMILIAVINIAVNPIFFQMEIWYIIVAVIVNTVAVIAVDGVFALIIRRLMPAKWFGMDKKGFYPGKGESRFMEKLGIKKWKDKVIELGMFTNFHKNKISDPTNNEYVERFIVESNYGFVIHLVCVFVGFVIIFFYPLKYWLCFGFPVAIVNAVLNALPTMILRYNLPKLRTLHKLNERTQLRAARAAAQSESVAPSKESVPVDDTTSKQSEVSQEEPKV